MKLTESQIESLELASEPLMAWLLEHCPPWTQIIVTSDRAELLKKVYTVRSDSLPERK